MPDNQGLSHLSDHFLIVAVVLYSLAVIAFAADFAFGRRSPVVTRAEAGVCDRVPAAVGAAAAEGGAADTVVPGVPESGAADGAADGVAPAAGEGGAAGTGAGRGGPAGQAAVPVSRLVRIALTLTTAGLPLHLAGVVSRGWRCTGSRGATCTSSSSRVPCVAVLFFLGLMIKYRPYHLGLFFMAPIVIIMGLAQTVIYTPAGPLVPALNSYWLAIHVTAMTLASGTFMVGAVSPSCTCSRRGTPGAWRPG